MPDTRGLAEMYWHKLGCTCAACADPLARELKYYRVTQTTDKTIVGSQPLPPLPQLPRQIEDLLQDD